MFVYLPSHQETYASGAFASASGDFVTCDPGGVTATEQVMRKTSFSRTIFSDSAVSAVSAADAPASAHRTPEARATRASYTSACLPATSFVLQLPTANFDVLFSPEELQTQLQIALAAAGVYLSPYALHCLRRHVLRSLSAGHRYFMPPLLPPVLLRPFACPCVSRESPAPTIHGGRSSYYVPEQRFYVAPEAVMHLVFQTWQNYLFLPIDAAAAAVVGFIPFSPDDEVAAAVLATWSCLAVKSRQTTSMRLTAASRKRNKNEENSAVSFASISTAALAAMGSARKKNEDLQYGVQAHIDRDAYPSRDTGFNLSRNNLQPAEGAADPLWMPTPFLSRPIPSFLCPREAALRALAYWSCLAELQNLKVRDQYGRLTSNGCSFEQGTTGEGRSLASFMSSSCAEDVSSIRLVYQLKQSFDSVMENVLNRQKEALDQLRERQSREMEEASGGYRDFTHIAPAPVVTTYETHRGLSSKPECTSAGSPRSPAEVGATAITASADCGLTIEAALREEIIAMKGDSSEGKGKSEYSSANHFVEASCNSMENTCADDAAPNTHAAECADDIPELPVGTGSSRDTSSVNYVKAVHPHAGAQGSTQLFVPAVENEDKDSDTTANDFSSINRPPNKDVARRNKIEALVLQHVSEFHLVEMHWKAESLLLRRQQLRDLKNVIVDLVLLRRAARQGSLSSPLILPPLPSASEGDATELLPKRTLSARTGSPFATGARKSHEVDSLPSTDLKRLGKTVRLGLRATTTGLPHKCASSEKKNHSGGKAEAGKPPQAARSEAAQVQRFAIHPTLAIPDDAETQEIHQLLRMYLPALRGPNKESGANADEETMMRIQQQAPASSAQMEGRGPGFSFARRPPLQVERRKCRTRGKDQGRLAVFTRSEREIPSVQQEAVHQPFSRSLREPMPAALQLVTPTKLFSRLLQQQQQPRLLLNGQEQVQPTISDGGRDTQTCNSTMCPPENQERHLSDGGAAEHPKNPLTSYFHRIAGTVAEIPCSSRSPEIGIPREEKAGAGALTQLDSWEDTVKNWSEEDALRQLQEHAFLPLIFGKQRKRCVVIRICSGNITDVAVCDLANSGQHNVRDTDTHPSTNGTNAGAFRANITWTLNDLPFGITKPASTWEDYDYCSDLAAGLGQSVDKLLSEVLMSLQSSGCSHCTGKPSNAGTGARQLASVRSAKTEIDAGAPGASGAAVHGFETSFASPFDPANSIIRETVDDKADTRTRRLHGPAIAESEAAGAAAAAGTDSSNYEEKAKERSLVGKYSARTAVDSENWISERTSLIRQSKKLRCQYSSSPFPMLGSRGVDPECEALGIVLPVGSSLKLTAPSHLRWQSQVSGTTDFLFPSLEEQRQMLYRTLLQEQHYGQLLDARLQGDLDAWRRMKIGEVSWGEAARRKSRNNDITFPADDWSVESEFPVHHCAPSRFVPQLHLGDVFISRHSNSGPVQAVFHLVVHEDRDPEEPLSRGGRPEPQPVSEKARGKETVPMCVLQGIGEVLRISSTEGLRTLLLPLFLVEGEAAVCSLTYACLQQRAFQVIRYILNELKDLYQDSSDAPSLRQIVLVLPPLPTNTATAKRILPKRANSKREPANINRRSVSVAFLQNVEQTVDAVSTDPRKGLGCVDSGRVENVHRCEDIYACKQHHPTALRNEPLPVNCYMEGVLTSIIAYLRNCGHCWVGKANSRFLRRIFPT